MPPLGPSNLQGSGGGNARDRGTALYRCFAALPKVGSIAGIVLSSERAGVTVRIGSDLGAPTTGFVTRLTASVPERPYACFFARVQENASDEYDWTRELASRRQICLSACVAIEYRCQGMLYTVWRA